MPAVVQAYGADEQARRLTSERLHLAENLAAAHRQRPLQLRHFKVSVGQVGLYDGAEFLEENVFDFGFRIAEFGLDSLLIWEVIGASL